MTDKKLKVLRDRMKELKDMESTTEIKKELFEIREKIRVLCNIEKTCLSCKGCQLQDDEKIFETHEWICNKTKIQIKNSEVEIKIDCKHYDFIG